MMVYVIVRAAIGNILWGEHVKMDDAAVCIRQYVAAFSRLLY